jgi:hypothetical protein
MSPILQAVNETSLHLLLQGRETLVVQGAGELCCEEGEVWLTEAGSDRDCILSPGDRWPLQSGLDVALSSLAGARLSLGAAA